MFEDLLPDIFKKNGTIIFTGEYAWKYRHAIELITFIKKTKHLILGGDVLNKNFEYTYDNWFFEINDLMLECEQVEKSAARAENYINWHHNTFGDEFYYVFVVE